MNYYEARQRKSDMRWDYTCMNDGQVWPVGFCRGWREYTPEQFAQIPGLRREYEKLLPLRDRFHSDGHPTREEAEACFYEWEVANLQRTRLLAERKQCEICHAWTDRVLTGQRGMDIAVLCAQHCNEQGYRMARPFVPGGKSISSY